MSDPSKNDVSDPGKPTPTRIAIWIAVGGVGLYFLVTGIVGIISQR